MIVDASVIVKWLNSSELDSDKALLLYKGHIERTTQISVPQLLFIEIANYLATNTKTSEANIRKSLNFLYESNLIICPVTEDLLIEAAILAKKHKTSVYDMVYAVLAKRNNTKLITADSKFANKVNFSFVQTLSKQASVKTI
ncbi:MAG: type II toxin-antitoxin system VapC family toxin [Candidatus Levybacteria bacterium]|nr:type II toxin-antitoxin system VapC family toxin [Candidatus Levybacteria bacterium]